MRKWILVFWSIAALAGCAPRGSADEVAVRDTLMRLFDKPDSRLIVEPIAVAGNAALAGWVQGEIGGRAQQEEADLPPAHLQKIASFQGVVRMHGTPSHTPAHEPRLRQASEFR
jgi:hypothetical protein